MAEKKKAPAKKAAAPAKKAPAKKAAEKKYFTNEIELPENGVFIGSGVYPHAGGKGGVYIGGIPECGIFCLFFRHIAVNIRGTGIESHGEAFAEIVSEIPFTQLFEFF